MGPMYHRTDSFDSNAAWSSGFEADSSAVAAEIDFGSEGLAPGGTYDVYLTVKTPGYTADQIEDYYQKLIANSAMVSVTRQMPEGVTAPDEVGYQDRTEPERVLATLNLPTGSLGDYVWYDENSNGLQDDGEEPASGVAVSLRKTTYFKVGDQTISKEETVKHTAADGTVDLDYRTDQNGSYEFTGLACNYLKPGAAEGSTDPDDYIGGEYYTYQVMFEIPEGYSATLKGQGDDPAVDSNMNSDGSTDPISLRVLEDENGGLYGEADTTIDAGLISPYAIGDTVWLDWNNNGVQDEGESGVAGVPVLLYKVGEDGVIGEGQGYYARMLTDEKGLYRFENLPEGYYIVRFDISELRKADGYTYAYDFTKSIAPEGTRADRDSDAKHWVDEDGRIRQTDVITLTRARLIEDNIYVPGKAMQEDNRYDAGLVVYSAIGGFCFYDRGLRRRSEASTSHFPERRWSSTRWRKTVPLPASRRRRPRWAPTEPTTLTTWSLTGTPRIIRSDSCSRRVIPVWTEMWGPTIPKIPTRSIRPDQTGGRAIPRRLHWRKIRWIRLGMPEPESTLRSATLSGETLTGTGNRIPGSLEFQACGSCSKAGPMPTRIGRITAKP